MFRPRNVALFIIALTLSSLGLGDEKNCRTLLTELSAPISRYDAVVVGAGPAGATMALHLAQANSRAKILVLEKAKSSGGTFHEHHTFYRLSTKNLPINANAIPGATLQTTDVTESGHVYPYPKDIKLVVEKALDESGAELRYETEVVDFEDQWGSTAAKNGRYLVTLADSSQLRTNSLIFATGQKPTLLNLFALQPRQFLEDELNRQNERILNFDDVAKKYQGAPAALDFQTIAIFGSGLAAFNLADFLVTRTSARVRWYVNSVQNVTQKIIDQEDRYAPLMTKIKNRDQIVMRDRPVVGVFKANAGFEITDDERLKAEQIWLATGSHSLEPIDLPGVKAKDAEFLPIFDDKFSGMIGKRLRLHGKPPQAIFVAGTAGGADQIPPETLRRGTSPLSLSEMLPRVAALAEHVHPTLRTTRLSPSLKAKIAQAIANQVPRSEAPELILMAGLPGSGKSKTAKALQAKHLVIDPDRIVELISNYHQNYALDPVKAVTNWHYRATQLQFPVVDLALSSNKSMILDGTLKNTEFFREFVARIRRDHPQYRIKLYYVWCPEQVAMERVARRAATEGRILPLLDFEKIRREIEKTVEELSPLVDEFQVLKNEDDNTSPTH